VHDTRTSAGNIAPCCYPGCRDEHGDPRLTRDTICEPSRKHYRKILDRHLLHWVLIRTTMPAPTVLRGTEKLMRVQTREYGHPREWASDTARAIADHLADAHASLAAALGHDGPPWQGHNETRRVQVSYLYLTNWFERLCTHPGAAASAVALYELDRDVRRGLGKTDPRRFLPVPCPNPDCKLLGLVREISRDDGKDEVNCHACGEKIPSDRYSWWTRQLLDDMIESAA
jgi:hypothetical protein